MVTRPAGHLPRLVVAAPSTGQGKTTIATGLMAALRARGLEVSGHKVGPDYIDPGYHAVATGRPGRNLDPHQVGVERIAPLLLHGARGADVAVVEGVMGLHDGRLGTDGFASTAHVAAITRTPVVLVVDIARMSRSTGALVAGMAAYDPAVEVVGVVLNRAGSARNVEEVRRSLRLPVLGVVPREESLATPSRHLGLVPAGERDEAAALVTRLGEHVARHVDLDAVLDVARSAPDLDATPWDPAREVTPVPGGPVVAVAGGRAFTFAYAETEELLAAAGCRVVRFDPLTDPALPDGTQALLLGGGFPEVHVGELARNTALLAQVREAVAAGLPTVAECAGMLYLLDSLDDVPMAGVIGTSAAMSERLVLRYPVARAVGDSLLTRAGEEVGGHEFHRTALTRAARGWTPAWEVDRELIGVASPTLHASYLHVHWAGHPHLAQRFAEAAAAAVPVPAPPAVEPPAPVASVVDLPPDPLLEPLLHHGDREVGPGLLDLAVNVHPEPRPAWLERALAEGVRASTNYPDPTPARAAIAELHRRRPDEVLVTAGAAEAFELVARWKQWRHVVVVHPQFTEPHAALERAGHRVTVVPCRAEDGYRLDPAAVPEDADLVVLGNPTNPTGVLHPAAEILRLRRPKRVVLVDEAFIDTVEGERESLARDRRRGLLVVRSLTKHWSLPGIRVGYVVGSERSIAGLAARQVPWSVSTPAVHAALACTGPVAVAEAGRRAARIAAWRSVLVAGLAERGVEVVESQASFVLARLGAGAREALRGQGVAVRRADTFPGLDGSWVRIAVRPPETTALLLGALDACALVPS
ncbi:cobyrinate a,c-diamide synthase [Nocardioides sp. SOB77]|uniref:Hydrogenobyrinate a,c-diamide synthase n=1 Tax=Nocardioides oceani TaxID=3058369 RepID=A0ABT8FD75_9ACTN|nr:cobyrinate a,c-diamide synthase [Nocardioides oceani]MDN4172611.1 cobyrinate a,c-diamide synthase [Nocardioides oceani]